MDYRHGKCGSCGAEYKVPASFQHDAARCKKCGGTVRIGKPGEAAPQAIPARKVAPPGAKKPTATPAAKKGGGTLERLRAERTADEPKQPHMPTATGARGGARAAAAAKRSKRGATRRADADNDGAVEEKPPGQRYTPRKKKSPIAGLVGIGAIVVIAIGVFLFKDSIFGTGDEGDNATTDNTVSAAETTDGTTDADESMDGASDEDPIEEPDPEPEEQPKTLEKVTKPKATADPSSVDLASEVPQFGPAYGMSAGDFLSLSEDVDLMMANEGAPSSRAERRVTALGPQAVPAILNKMKTFDYGTEQGKDDGFYCQRILEEIHAGMNFSWKDGIDPESHYFNKRVVVFWGKLWGACENDLENFIKKTGLEEKNAARAQELRDQFGAAAGGGAIGGGEEDDLDVD